MAEAPLAVLVLGPHRSGTSCVTELVHALGFELGRELLGARPDNPRGLWENAALVAASEDLLARAASAWYDPGFLELDELLDPAIIRESLAAAVAAQFRRTPIVIKDPRLCRLAGPCAAVLRQLGYRVRFVLVLRDPRASAESLYRRDGIPCAVGIGLWLAHMLGALSVLRGEPVLMVDYDRLLRDDEPLLDLATWLRDGARPDLDLLEPLRACRAPELRHHTGGSAEAAAAPLANLAATVFMALREAADARVGAAVLAAWIGHFRLAMSESRWLAGRPLVVMHGGADLSALPVVPSDLEGAGLLLMLDGEEGMDPAPDLLGLAASGRIGLFWNLEVRGEAASLARGMTLAGMAQDVLLLRAAGAALLGPIRRRCAGREPLELVSASGAPLALWLPAPVARGIDGWSHVAHGNDAWVSLVAAVRARRDLVVPAAAFPAR